MMTVLLRDAMLRRLQCVVASLRGALGAGCPSITLPISILPIPRTSVTT